MRRTTIDRTLVPLPTAVVAIIPVSCALLGLIVTAVPISISGGLLPPPMFALMPIYFWCLVRPDLMPPAVVFAVGILEDLLMGGPPGLWAASFVATYIFVDQQRDSLAGLAGWAAILGFAIAMLIASVSAFLIAWIYFWRLPTLEPLALQLAGSVLFFIPIVSILHWIHRRFVGPLRSDI